MGDRIDVDAVMYPGNSYTSQNGQYTLIFQEDSNFVLYKRNGDNQDPIWASNTWAGDSSATNKSVILQTDGNFVMYDGEGQPLWASNTGGYEGVNRPYIMVQDDGNVCMYDEALEGQCLWNTGTYQG
ncbi:hypothetical protein H2198_005288 [Neophaeococcomyces mojaviensis]|uniref:Uncharacterized protein n=1 Tax=Neophaeococcomyces mojaviensis TaxID=3383035 RepID=A0ACC3A619_9EURO|nr:hypothetical protein H2198_005288 [Knufia sp. JES_112]